MPSKKKKNRRNKKQKEEDKIERTTTEENPTPQIITTDVDTKVENQNDNGDDVKEIFTGDIIDVSENDINDSKSTPIKKKRFSFLKKKNRSSSLLHVNMDDSNNSQDDAATVKRAHSISTFGREEHKSKIPRFRSLSSSNKKKNLSASCSNVESTSLVLNPGMDSWRMTGLLNTVDKSNSVHSLNVSVQSEKDSPTIALVPSTVNEGAEEIEVQEKPITDVIKQPKIKQTQITTSSKDVVKPCIEVNELKVDNTEGFVETDIDFEYSAEIHEDKSSVAASNEPIITHSTPSVKSNATTTPTKVMTTPSIESLSINGPTLKDALTNADLYELENHSVVSIRNLDDVVRENKMHLPAEVISTDWLVLNLCSNRPIESF